MELNGGFSQGLPEWTGSVDVGSSLLANLHFRCNGFQTSPMRSRVVNRTRGQTQGPKLRVI